MSDKPDTTAGRVLAAVHAIPVGRTASYGEIARRVGIARGARRVARVLATAGEAGLPWHRVVRADGRIAFPAGHPLHDEQCRRLRAEGVSVRAGRVATASARVEFDLDALIWAPRENPRRRR